MINITKNINNGYVNKLTTSKLKTYNDKMFMFYIFFILEIV